MNTKPIAKSEILKELQEYQNQDYKYESGRILGSMCTQAHPFAKEVFIKTSLANGCACVHIEPNILPDSYL